MLRAQWPNRKQWGINKGPIQHHDDLRDDRRDDLRGDLHGGSHYDGLRDDFCDDRDDCSQRDVKAEVVECHNRAELRLAVAPPKAAVGMDNNLAVEFPTVAIGRL